MWIAYALGSALSASLVAILAKAGMRNVPSNLATLIRTLVACGLAWLLVLAAGAQSSLATASARTLVFLVLSGLAAGASWLCMFRALQAGPINPVMAIDKSSIVLTVLLGIVLLGEVQHLPLRLTGIAVIAAGTYLMVRWQPGGAPQPGRRAWVGYALLSAAFASLTTVLAKVGVAGIDSNAATAIRTVAILALALAATLATGQQRQVRGLPRRDVALLVLSGAATGASWLCFFKALQLGPVTGVVPIDRLSIVATAVLAYLVFGERLTRRGLLGLALITAGTWAMIA
ncbi:MAG: EamA family transporter [Actinomycetales bacterium]|nr:EamA family transporter [Actinomycetales bacterium]